MFNPFSPTYIQQAADTLTVWFKQWRDQIPFLPRHITYQDWCYTGVNEWFKQTRPGGAVNTQTGDFLIAETRDNEFFGQHCWSPLIGNGFSPNSGFRNQSDLYAKAGQDWLNQHIANHYLITPALPDTILNWQKLGFGIQQTYALLDLDQKRPDIVSHTGFEIRPAAVNDKEKLADVSPWIAQRLHAAPVWAPLPPQHLSNLRKGFSELPTEKGAKTWLILKDKQIMGFAVYYPAPPNQQDPLNGDKWVELAVAAVHPLWRGQGIGRMLIEYTLKQIQKEGYAVCKTDWRTANAATDHFWLASGFVPAAYRLVRTINPAYLTTRKNAL